MREQIYSQTEICGQTCVLQGAPSVVSGYMKTGKPSTKLTAYGNLKLDNFHFDLKLNPRGTVEVIGIPEDRTSGYLMMLPGVTFDGGAGVICRANLMDLQIPEKSTKNYNGTSVFISPFIEGVEIGQLRQMGSPLFEFYASDGHLRDNHAPEVRDSSVTLRNVPSDLKVTGFDYATFTEITFHGRKSDAEIKPTIICRHIVAGKVQGPCLLRASDVKISNLCGNLKIEKEPGEAHVAIHEINPVSSNSWPIEIDALGCTVSLGRVPNIPSRLAAAPKPQLTIHLGDGELRLPEKANPQEVDAFLSNPEVSITGGTKINIYGSTIHLPTNGNGIASVAEYVKNLRERKV